jgi:cytoskeletal protein RodZ
MGVFGERMRRERELRGVSLEEISLSTKISKRHLEELERENFDALPGGIFNKGFVRAYARYLGIDEEQAVADYVAADKQEPPPEEKFPLDVHVRPDPVLNPRRSLMPVFLALLILGCVAAGWTYWFKYRPTHQAKAPANSSVPAPRAPALSTTASDSPQTAPPDSSAVSEVAVHPRPVTANSL